MELLNSLRLCVLLSTVLCAMPAQAQIYSCVTDDGRTITSDKPVPECAKRKMRELRDDGALRRTILPPLTHAQREAKKRALIAKRLARARQRQEQAQDEALMNAYPSMSALERMRERRLAEVQDQIDSTYQRMVKLHKKLRAAKAEFLAYPEGEAPGQIQQKVDQIAISISSEDTVVKSQLIEQEQIRERFAKDEARLRVLLEAIEKRQRQIRG